jgi:hypothetical protein
MKYQGDPIPKTSNRGYIMSIEGRLEEIEGYLISRSKAVNRLQFYQSKKTLNLKQIINNYIRSIHSIDSIIDRHVTTIKDACIKIDKAWFPSKLKKSANSMCLVVSKLVPITREGA